MEGQDEVELETHRGHLAFGYEERRRHSAEERARRTGKWSTGY